MGLTQSDQTWIVSSLSILQQCKSQKQLHQRMIFIESRNINKPQLTIDNIDIYRLKQAPYESLMKISRVTFIFLSNLQTFQNQSPMLLEYSQTLKKLSEEIKHKNIATIHFINICNQNNMCMRTVKIQNYSTYYGIQLRDVIENRKNQDFRFTQGQILYVAKSLINFGLYLKKNHNIAFGHYQSKNIFLTDNGYIKLYLFHILPQNKHTNYFTLLSSSTKPSISQLPISPQIFKQLHQNNMTPVFDSYKSDIFSIGMILIQMIMQSTLQRYYKFGRDNVGFNQINLRKDIDQIKGCGIYDNKIIRLLEKLLEVKPERRWSFEEADRYLDQIKRQFQFACRLNLRYEELEQGEQQIKKISFKSQQPESQYVLRSIQNSLQSKLNPLPLKSLSKLVTNKSKPQNQISNQKSIYTRRRNTGVSIISSSSQNNNLSVSKKGEQKSSKFTTVRNSRVGQNIVLLNKGQKHSNDISLVTDFETKIYASEKFSNQLLQYDMQSHYREKNSQNWLTLGNTRLTQQNSKTFTFLPPKIKKSNGLQRSSVNSNPKLHIQIKNKQNQKSSDRNFTGISTHIKIHKKNIVSPRLKQQNQSVKAQSRQKKIQENSILLGLKNNSLNKQKQNIPIQLTEQAVVRPQKTVRPTKMKINQHIR